VTQTCPLGSETVRIKAILAPSHSMEQALCLMELNGHRVVLTGDIGSEKNDILNRCWGDVEKAKLVTEIVRTRLLPFKPEFNFAGHRARPNATAFLEELVRNAAQAIANAEQDKRNARKP